MIDKTIRVTQLYDVYGKLLTPTQRQYIEYYYFDDLSLKEVAEELGVSRNAIHDSLKRTVELMEHYEANLHVLRLEQTIQAIKASHTLQEVHDFIESFERSKEE